MRRSTLWAVVAASGEGRKEEKMQTEENGRKEERRIGSNHSSEVALSVLGKHLAVSELRFAIEAAERARVK